MSRMLWTAAAIATLSLQAQSAPPCPAAAWAWANAEPDPTPSAAWAWAVAKAPDEIVPIAPPKSKGYVSIKGWHFPQANEVSEPGNHWHKCDCGRVCQHGDEHKGDLAEHTCVCGRLNYEKVPGLSLKKIALPTLIANCPDGRCPK